MKKYMILFLAAALLASCSDWLDVTPKDRMLEKDQFATEENINQAHNGLYREMSGENLYGGQLSQTTVERLAHYYTYPPADPGPEPFTRPWYLLAGFQYNTDEDVEARFASIWSSAYATLLHINTYIKNLNESTAVISEENKSILLGEAYGLRAYIHFDLFRLFGPAWQNKTGGKILPYHNKPEVTLNHTGYEEAEYSTADEFMTLLLGDIAEAEKLLENNDPVIDDDESITHDLRNDNFYQNRNRRMNYYAVKGLEARVRQYRGEHGLAAAAAKVVTDRMEDRFEWVNLDAFNSNAYMDYVFFDEVIFGINNLEMNVRATGWYMGTEMRRSSVVDKDNLESNIFGEYSGSGFGSLPDVRDRQWVASSVIDFMGAYFSQNGSYVSKKYLYKSKGEGEQIPAIKDLQVLMRVSEMYYIQAEAALKEGRKADAVTFLNEVLHHRGLTSQYDRLETDSDSDIQAHIMREYYREFFGEGQVFFYHKRNGSTSMFNGNAGGSSPVSNPGSAYVIPIPDTETNI